jgi:hypothetical protein
MTEQIEISDSNFEDYFFDVRMHTPKQGQIIACFTATAELVKGPEKKNVIDLLRDTDKMIATTQVMRKLLHASEVDSYRVPRQMAADMALGMSIEDCMEKPYKYTLEMFYYTLPEYIPKDDPHWSSVSIVNLQDYFDKRDERIKSRILSDEEAKRVKIDSNQIEVLDDGDICS